MTEQKSNYVDCPPDLKTAPENLGVLMELVNLLTYTLAQGARITRRATIWRRCGSDWKIVYHQGTIVEDA